ncbi:MAG: family 1 encapsulin nanocompartment shell protein [bacterium]
MDYLSREGSPVSQELWKQIDTAVVESARRILAGRRFLHIFGPLGIGADSIAIDDADKIGEITKNGLTVTAGRKHVEIPTVYDDVTLLAKDLESSRKSGYPVDLSAVMASAEACALKEDRLIFFGAEELGYEGLLTAAGTNRIEKKDWSEGENAFTDIAAAIQLLTSKNVYGTYALAVSPDLYLQMQRIQPGTGLLEIERVKKLLNGNVVSSPVLGNDEAVLVCTEPRNIDLVIGQDLAAAYLEQKDLNHCFRILETVLLRIKRRQAIVVFE